MHRYYVPVMVEDDELVTNVILPKAVGETIRAAFLNGLTHGSVTHIRTLRGADETIPELYCWDVA